MGHIVCLASVSAALTAALSLFAGFGSETAPAVPAGPPPQAEVAMVADAAVTRSIRTIPIDGRYGLARAPAPR